MKAPPVRVTFTTDGPVVRIRCVGPARWAVLIAMAVAARMARQPALGVITTQVTPYADETRLLLWCRDAAGAAAVADGAVSMCRATLGLDTAPALRAAADDDAPPTSRPPALPRPPPTENDNAAG